jgi:hypothetical protein
MALHSAEFSFLIPSQAVPRQNCFPMPVSMVQFGQKLPVLPLLGNMESGWNRNQKSIRGISVERAEAIRAFSVDDRVLLGLVAASLV